MHPIETPDKTFHDGDGVSELGTILPAWWLNQVQSELLAVLTAAGIQPDKNKTDQLLDAIKKVAPKSSPATTTVAGVVKLINNLTSGGTDAALSAEQGKVLAGLIASAIPSGAVMYFAGQTAPSGWLKANGAAVSRSTYAALFAAIGTTYGAGDGSSTFNLPDLRGEFVRGWDDGRGIDSGRAFGSAQSDAIRNITGGIEALYSGYRYTLYTKADGAFTMDLDDGANSTFSSSKGDSDHNNRKKRVVFDASRSVPTADENRPRNIALLACIKI